MEKGHSVTYQMTSTRSGKANGSLEIVLIILISKQKSKEGFNFYNFGSYQHLYEYMDTIF